MSATPERIRAGVVPIATWTHPPDEFAVFRYVDISSVDRESKSLVGATELPAREAPSRARQLLRADDVLVSTVRPNLNAVAMVPAELDGAVGSTGFTVLRANPTRLLPSYLFHWVRTPMFVADMVKKATGASYPAVSDRIVLDSSMPMPNVEEQRRIADMLDKADAIRRKRKEAIALTEDLLRSAFLEMFGDPVANPKKWPTEAIDELCVRGASLVDGPFGSSLKPEHYVESGVKVVRNWNIYDDRFDFSAFKYVTPSKFGELRRSEVRQGDVLITTKGTVGDVCVAPDLEGPAVLSASGTVRLRVPPDSSYLPEFVVGQMTTATYKRYLHGFEAGSAQQYLNLSVLKKMRLIRPPIERQRDFSQLRSRLRATRSRTASAALESEQLFASLAEQSFAPRPL